MTLTLSLLQGMWPHGDQHVPGLLEAIAGGGATFEKYGVGGDLVLAHFMAQWSEECGAGQEMVENMNYSAQGLERTWPTRFNASRAARYAHNPQMIGETVYGGRMGNDPAPSHDGYLYRGRGLTQVTGKEDYDRVGVILDIDLVANPELVNDTRFVLEVACIDMAKLCTYGGQTCLQWAQKDNVLDVTRALNGGTIGLSDRELWLRRWKTALHV